MTRKSYPTFLVLFVAIVSCSEPAEEEAATGRAAVQSTVSEAAPGTVNVYRDVWGMPHVYAEREEDGFWGLGYAEGEDRLYSLLYNYLSVKGELASRFGNGPTDVDGRTSPPNQMAMTGRGYFEWGGPEKNLVQQDIHARRWRFLRNARENFSSLSVQTQANMTAYISGVQQFMDDNPEKVPAWAPELEPALPAAIAREMVMSGTGICDGLIPALATASVWKEEKTPTFTASNAFALAPERTEAGAALFSSDAHHLNVIVAGTHLNSARIKAGELDAYLVGAAGMPIGLKGHSRHYAWGVTEGGRFPSDCIAVKTLADDPTTYEVDGDVHHMQVESYVIEVKGEASVEGEFHYTRHNGVLSPVVHRDGETAYAVSSTNMGRAGAAIEQYRMMLGARTEQELEGALSNRDIYPANTVIAGADGTIRYIRPGRTPIRPDGADGMAIVDGSTSSTAWLGIRPFEELLYLVDPAEGYLNNSNISPDMMFAESKIKPEDYPPDFGFQPGYTGTRQRRSIQLLGGDRKFSFEEAIAVVTDAHALGFEKWSAAFVSLGEQFADDEAFDDPAFAEFFDALISLDGNFVPESRPALVHHLTRNTLREMNGEPAFAIEIAVQSELPLSQEQEAVLFSAVGSAFERLQQRPDAATATFGDVYRVGRGDTRAPSRGVALMLGEGMISFFPSSYAPDGDSGEYVSLGGSRYPFIVQFTTPIRSMSAAAYGASDDPDSPHYSDQSVLRAEGKLRSNHFNPEELEGAIESVETFETGIAVTRQR